MHKAFFGDRERDFVLTPHLIPELERLTGKGIGALVEGVRRASFAEITATIRLALIGGGAPPQEADALVKNYVPARPLGEAHLLALDILTDLWTGQAGEDAACTASPPGVLRSVPAATASPPPPPAALRLDSASHCAICSSLGLASEAAMRPP